MSLSENHIHDCTGPDQRCPCGFVFRVPPIYVAVEVADGRKVLASDHFSCETVQGAILALRDAANKLERLAR